jgi:hypothetical protein
LDSASERSYQAVFVQMLSALGHKVVHSTRHTALEFGKDILSIAPDGVGCAFQLKGNPGGRLGLKTFRTEIQPQLVQLMSQAVVYPGFPSEPHKAYLVSNGYFEEEVHRAMDDLNRMPAYPSKVTLISRGEMLNWSKSLGASLWPSELPDIRLLLELFLADSKDLLPVEKLATLVSKVLATDSSSSGVGRAEFHRAVASAALLTGIATSAFAESGNNFAVASAWCLLAVTVIGASAKHGHPLQDGALETLLLAEAAAVDALAALWKDVDGRKHLVEGNALADPEVHGWRYATLLGALTCLGIYNDDTSALDASSGSRLRAWLTKRHEGIDLWGEGAVANMAPWLMYLRKHDSTLRVDFEIARLTELLIDRNQQDSQGPLASPYYTFEEVARFRLHLDKSGEASGVGRETFVGSSFTAEQLFHLLVRTNLKQKCKTLWPDFTRLGHRRNIADQGWEYCALKMSSGVDETKIYPSTYEWTQIKKDAREQDLSGIPSDLALRPWLLALWWQVAPHRYTCSASCLLAETLLPGWGS